MKSSTPRDAVRLSPNAITVLEKRYLIKDESGAPVETPRDLFQRVARTAPGRGRERPRARLARLAWPGPRD